MAYVTTCTKCGKAYEADSEENACEPTTRVCMACRIEESRTYYRAHWHKVIDQMDALSHAIEAHERQAMDKASPCWRQVNEIALVKGMFCSALNVLAGITLQ